MYLAFSEPLGTDEYERITVADHIGTGVDVRDRRTAQILEGLRREDEERATVRRERERARVRMRERKEREGKRERMWMSVSSCIVDGIWNSNVGTWYTRPSRARFFAMAVSVMQTTTTRPTARASVHARNSS